MLTEPCCQSFRALQSAIDRLSQLLAAGKLTAAEIEAAQQVFQTQIMPLELEKLDPTIAAKLQSIQTEISKQFRLLATDVVFLKAARQSSTAVQRQGQIRDRLSMLQQYCEVVLESGEETNG